MKTAYSIKTTPEEVSKDIQSQLGPSEPKAVVFFASCAFAPEAISREMQSAFPGVSVFGCTTAGEIISGKMLKRSVVAMAFDDKSLEQISLSLIEDITSKTAVEDALGVFEKQYGCAMMDFDQEAYVGLILVDGLCKCEEKLIDRIGDLTNVLFIGGSAGDDLQFKQTYVFANGKAYPNAALLALLKPRAGFKTIKTQSFKVLDQQLVATRVNEANREVLEFNGKNAAAAYAESVGVAVEDAPKHFISNPVGLLVDGEPYVRSPQQIKADGMVFYCNMKEKMRLSILETTDIVSDTRDVISATKARMGNIGAIINFNCILRTLELEDKGLADAYGNLFTDIPTIGFSTYGEQCVGHVNQTATMLVLKACA